jgi:hypothetical protein
MERRGGWSVWRNGEFREMSSLGVVRYAALSFETASLGGRAEPDHGEMWGI